MDGRAAVAALQLTADKQAGEQTGQRTHTQAHMPPAKAPSSTHMYMSVHRRIPAHTRTPQAYLRMPGMLPGVWVRAPLPLGLCEENLCSWIGA